MASLRNWVWLSLCINYTSISRVLDRFDTPENVFVAEEKELSTMLSKKEVERILEKDFSKADEILEDCFNKEITVFAINDSMYPEILRGIVNPPLVIYMKGRLPDLDNKVGIGVVGTRVPTVYGNLVAKKLCITLAQKGIIIISGMAKGIDTVANQASILANMPTVAVLGCSVDYCYPFENRKLMDDIIAVGAVISEFPPTTKPIPANFPQRNRILSGISKGVLVVEAPKKSGSLITAACALEQGRDIFAIPGNIDNSNSYGCNELIKIGAKMVTNPYDILSEYKSELESKIEETYLKENMKIYKVDENDSILPILNANLEEHTEKAVEKTIEKHIEKTVDTPKTKICEKKLREMKPNEQKVYDIIMQGTETVDEIIEQSELRASEVMMYITMLELNGEIENIASRIRIKE
ncbi:MAG: DNA-processing protein DprA [Clostridia bacterium]